MYPNFSLWISDLLLNDQISPCPVKMNCKASRVLTYFCVNKKACASLK